MKKIIDKNTVIFTGIIAISVVIAVLAITIYFGMRAGGSITKVVAIIFLKTKIQMGFFIANTILIVLFCFNLSSDKLFRKLFAPALIVAVAMLFINLLLIPINFIAIFIALFWAFTLVHLYQKEEE
jgi:hypothetical protein